MVLESKFIEGTNNQYSIRNDGVVISHYSLSGGVLTKREKLISKKLKKNQIYKSYISTIYIQGIQRDIRIETLLFKYFNIQTCRECEEEIINNKRTYLCPSCKKSHTSVNQDKWKTKNPDKQKKYCSISNTKKRQNITKSYMSSLLKMPVEDISEELFEDFKNTLKVKRLLAQKLNCSIQKLR